MYKVTKIDGIFYIAKFTLLKTYFYFTFPFYDSEGENKKGFLDDPLLD